MKNRWACYILAAGLALGIATFSHATTHEFYKGKTIRIVVGTPTGSAYDAWARLLGHHWGRHIPGNPTFIVQNMTGAGSLIAANYIYTVAKPDGLTLGSIIPLLYFNQLAGRKEVRFDWSKFTYLGSPDRLLNLLYVRADTPFKTIHDVRKAAEPPKCSASATGTTGHSVPRLLEETIGIKFTMIMGYQSASEMDIALERNEVNCRAISISAWFSDDTHRRWRDANFTRVLVQTGPKRDERLPQVPLLSELMDEYKTPEQLRRLAAVILGAGDLGRPYVAPPGLPGELTKILRGSFAKTFNDPDFLVDAKKRNLDVVFSAGEELEKLSNEVIQQPPEIIERVIKFLAK